MRYFITRDQDYYESLLSEEKDWELAEPRDLLMWVGSLSNSELIQLDTETDMVQDGPNAWKDRELLLIQLGSADGETQYIIHWSMFQDPSMKNVLGNILRTRTFIAHNARFEYLVIKTNLGIEVEHLHDTYLMSQVLNTGLELEKGYHSLAGCLMRFFNIDMSKAAQTTFTKDALSVEQLNYAADDVVALQLLFDKLKELLESWDLWFVYDRVEREVMKVYADMTLTEMNFDEKAWDKLSDELEVENTKLIQELNKLVMDDEKLVAYLKKSDLVLKHKLVQDHDVYTYNWASNVDRQVLLLKLVPELAQLSKLTKPEVKKFWKKGELSKTKQRLLEHYLERNYEVLDRYLQLYHKDWLDKTGYFIPAGKVLINWASTHDRLYVFQFYYPNLESTNAKALNRIKKNELINKFKEFSKINKYMTTYGAGFKKKYLNRDGKIAPTDFRQILTTGRIAAGILLQMPAKNIFRNAFLPPDEGWVFVDSDYSSQELAIMAYLAKEEGLMDVIRTGKDAHMFVTQKLFPEDWQKAAEPGCIHLTTGKRCSCKTHNEMRNKGKTFNFGIPFGMTYVGLAERLNISRREAQVMLNKYYKEFPGLKKFFAESEEFGMTNQYIRSAPPTKRIRFFHTPEHNGELQAIGRESKNFPIQETAASMVKIALIKLRKYIKKHNFPAKLILPVHDEILSACPKDKAEEWKKIQERAMTEAADLYLEKGLLGVETKITDRWTK